MGNVKHIFLLLGETCLSVVPKDRLAMMFLIFRDSSNRLTIKAQFGNFTVLSLLGKLPAPLLHPSLKPLIDNKECDLGCLEQLSELLNTLKQEFQWIIHFDEKLIPHPIEAI